MNTTATIISSQRHRDESIVAEKRAEKDYRVYISPEFEVDGERYAIVLDGHHSHEAARLDGQEPEYIEQTIQQNDAILLLQYGEVEGFLEVIQGDSDFYDINTGLDVW